MKRIFLLLLMGCTPFLNNCKRETGKIVTKDYFVVWFCGGMVWTPHETYYSITDTNVACDTMHQPCYFPKSIGELLFNVPMPDSIFMKLKTLPSSIPLEMLNNPQGTFGASAIDGGETMIWAAKNGISYRWVFESDLNNCSQEVKDFAQKLYSGL